MGLFINTVNASNHTKYVSLSNKKCEIQPTLINLHPNEYSQEFHYYHFLVKLDSVLEVAILWMIYLIKYVFQKKPNDWDLIIFSMITGFNESKTLTNHISCQCKRKFYGTKCKWYQWLKNDNCQCKCKKHYICKKDYVWNPATSNCENGKYLESIMDDSMITWDEVIN